jgi:hypothetical protein
MCGEVQPVITRYLTDGNARSLWKSFKCIDGVLCLSEVMIEQPNNDGPLKSSLPLVFTFTVRSSNVSIDDYVCGFTLCDQDGTRVFSTFFNDLGDCDQEAAISGTRKLRCTLPAHFLNEGTFTVLIDVGIAKVQRFTRDDTHFITFDISNPDGVGSRFGLGRLWRNTPLTPLLNWELLAE